MFDGAVQALPTARLLRFGAVPYWPVGLSDTVNGALPIVSVLETYETV